MAILTHLLPLYLREYDQLDGEAIKRIIDAGGSL